MSDPSFLPKSKAQILTDIDTISEKIANLIEQLKFAVKHDETKLVMRKLFQELESKKLERKDLYEQFKIAIKKHDENIIK